MQTPAQKKITDTVSWQLVQLLSTNKVEIELHTNLIKNNEIIKYIEDNFINAHGCTPLCAQSFRN